jgi:hypothetical protein
LSGCGRSSGNRREDGRQNDEEHAERPALRWGRHRVIVAYARGRFEVARTG